MKKIFTLISTFVLALSANAALETVASYTVASDDPVDGSEIAGTNCTVQLHTAALKANADDATKFGAQLNSETKYVQIDFAEALQAGDIIFISYFMGSNPTADDTEGVSLANAKTTDEDYVELAKLYAQTSDKKSIVSGGYIAAGGETRAIIYRLNSTTMFYQVKVVRGYASSIDFTNPALNTTDAVNENIQDAANLSLTQDVDGENDITVWNNVAGQTASFFFVGAPISISYKNSSAKTFAKARVTGYQFNGSGAVMKITCNVGAKVTITTGTYSKDGGAKVVGAEETEVSFPKNTATVATLTSTSNCITLTNTGAYLIEKIEIVNPASGVESVKAANVAAQDGATYNMAGQKVSADYKGVVVKDGKKFMQK